MSLATVSLKEKLNQKQLLLVQSEFDKAAKSKTVAYVMWFFLGVIGGHRFYSRNPLMGLGMLLTLGGFGIWTLIDVFFIGKRIEDLNDEIETELIRDVTNMTKPDSRVETPVS